VIEEFVGDKELREEFNALFSVLSKYYDRVLPNPIALNYKEGVSVLAFIRQSVANRTRDPRFSMIDASAKVRAIIEKYLVVNGIGVEVPPIDILSPNFMTETESSTKSDRAIADELTFAVTEYINENKAKDPELYERFAERLAKILDEFKKNWAALRKALEIFVKNDLHNGRKQEQSYGFANPNQSLPFFSLLRRELFGERKFEDLTEVEINSLKDFTDDCVSRLEIDTMKVNFWGQDSQIKQLRADLRKKLFDLEVTIPSLVSGNKANDVIQRVIELGKERFK
jgi:type I restriction enzyme R subunit